MARCENILSSLETKGKVVIEITFLWKIWGKVGSGVIRHDKIWQDVITFEAAWERNLK